ncbi:unnamed protein product [Allacma fusca]|uniref:Dendritic cell-specific transmembrane protein-like domain-containing protein n=1 Tax=Allacma fusca TaxID=39272 RepID=A0A8J2K0K5_9HEXA|nr:unnamed protein product [Allacma fusca]
MALDSRRVLQYLYTFGVKRFLLTLIVYSVLIYLLLYLQFKDANQLYLALGTVTSGLVVSILATIFTPFRCILCLCIPEVTSSIGRKLILTILVVVVLSGPIKNTMENLNRTSSTMACVGKILEEQAYESKALLKEANRRIEEKLLGVLNSVKKIPQVLTQEVLRPLIQQVDKVREAFETAGKSVREISQKCTSSVSSIRSNCARDTEDVLRKCRGLRIPLPSIPFVKIPDIDLSFICSPLNFIPDTCKVFDMSALCAPLTNIGNLETHLPGFSGYITKFKDLFELNVRVDKPGTKTESNLGNVTQTIKKRAKARFQEWHDFFNEIVKYLKWFSSATILLLPIGATLFYRSVKKSPGDVSQEGSSLMEKLIKKKSKKTKVGGKTKKQKSITKKLIPILSMTIGFTLVFVLERAVHMSVEVAKSSSNETIIITGTSKIKVNVNGGDVFRGILENMLSNFELDENVSLNVNLGDCIEAPVEPTGIGSILGVAAGILLMVATVIVERWVLKKRLAIVKFFYPDAVLWEYEEIDNNEAFN